MRWQLLILSLFTLTETALAKNCGELLNKLLLNENFVAPIKEIKTINDLGRAMTYGMLLPLKENDLFDMYRYAFLGDPRKFIEYKSLADVYQVMQKYYKLSKPPLREIELQLFNQLFVQPPELKTLVEALLKNYERDLSTLFNVNANIDHWIKIFEVKNRAELLALIPDDLIHFLSDEKNNPDQKILKLFKLFNRQIKKNSSPPLTLLKLEIVAMMENAPLHRSEILDALKSKNPADVVNGLHALIKERDSLAIKLGFKDGFSTLAHTFIPSHEPFINTEIISRLESVVQENPIKRERREHYRIRTLSLQESPFRSCLGKECSTVKYFEKALDPNYYYYTLTDDSYHSTGQATIVLGTAKDGDDRDIQIAFLDKIQNIETDKVIPFLIGIRRSLNEHGYQLAFPVDLEGENGLTNSEEIRNYFATTIIPKLSSKLMGFKQHQYIFEYSSGFSRANRDLDLLIFDLPEETRGNYQLSKGAIYNSYTSDLINIQTLASDFLNLKNSTDEADLISYVSNSRVAMTLEKVNLYTLVSYYGDLKNILSDRLKSMKVRKLALYVLITKQPDDAYFQLLKYLQYSNFTEQEIKQIGGEIRQWSKTNDPIRKKIGQRIESEYLEATIAKKIETITTLEKLNLVKAAAPSPPQ